MYKKIGLKSPYLSDSNRLGDVIAAIQVMGTYKFYKLDFDGWSERINADKTKSTEWKRIFEEHPEFFRLDTTRQKASLVWRRQYPKRFDVDKNEIISKEAFSHLTIEERFRISRNPLNSSNIEALINTAIELHSRALQFEQDKRWWINLIIPAVGGLVGALLGALVKS